jgi:N-acetylmuramoyl-L-alanine amidase
VRGDTLDRISRQHGVSIDAIKRANGMTNDTVILGARLRIP